MLHKLDVGQFKDGLRRYFKGSDSLGGQPLPEVNKALIEDAPRVVRLTIWGVVLRVPDRVGQRRTHRRSYAG